jgi:hypothetical protein
MLTAKHLGIVDLLSRDLAIVPELVARAQGRPPPADLRYEKRDGRLVAYSFSGPPREIQVDLLLLAFQADVPGSPPQIAVPFECQLGKDPEKLFRYVEYMATARRDNRCRGSTVVFSPDDEVLEYIRRLFEAEPHLCPVLVGRDAVPTVLTLDEAIARPELVTFCAIVHAESEFGSTLARQAMVSARYVECPRGQANVRILINCLTEDQMNELQRTPEYCETTDEWGTWEPGPWLRQRAIWTRPEREGREQGLAEGREQGLAEGREAGLEAGRGEGLQLSKQALKLLLTSRGLVASPEQLAVIDGCTSFPTIEQWITQAPRVTSVAELLAA